MHIFIGKQFYIWNHLPAAGRQISPMTPIELIGVILLLNLRNLWNLCFQKKIKFLYM
jgi:hypothetical protein